MRWLSNRKGTVRLTHCEAESGYLAVMPIARDPVYRRHRFPPEVISHAVWLYFRFPLSLRMVEEMLVERGICVISETVRQWGRSSVGASPTKSAGGLRLAATNGIWTKSWSRSLASSPAHWLWCAVDQKWLRPRRSLVQRRRDATAARGLLWRLLEFGATPPRVAVTDKLRSTSSS